MSEPGKIYALLPKAMAAIGGVGKHGKNKQQGYEFRKLDDLYAAVMPALSNVGIGVEPQVLDYELEQGKTAKGTAYNRCILRLRSRFYADDASSIEAITIGEAQDYGDKVVNKAMSAAMKYALVLTFQIPTDEPIDTEHESPELGERTPPVKGRTNQDTTSAQTQAPKPPGAYKSLVSDLDEACAKGIDELNSFVESLGNDKRISWLSDDEREALRTTVQMYRGRLSKTA